MSQGGQIAVMAMIELVRHAATAHVGNKAEQHRKQHEMQMLQAQIAASDRRAQEQARFLTQMHANLMEVDRAKLEALMSLGRALLDLAKSEMDMLHQERMIFAPILVGADDMAANRADKRLREIDAQTRDLRAYALSLAGMFGEFILRLPNGATGFEQLKLLAHRQAEA